MLSLVLILFPSLFSTSANLQEPVSPEMQAAIDRIAPKVAETRGLAILDPIPVGIQSKEGLLEFMWKNIEQAYPARRLEAIETQYKFLGFIPAQASLTKLFEDLLTQGVGGYYDYRFDKRFYVMEAFSKGGSSTEIIIAHELCHALEDQYYDLGNIIRQSLHNTDLSTAHASIIEGSATILMTQYIAQYFGEGLDPYFEAQEREGLPDYDESLESAMDGPPVLVSMMTFPYTEGAKFISRNPLGIGVPSAENWARVWSDLPLSTEQILHPEKYWDPQQRDDPRIVKLPDVSSQLGNSWELVESDTLGELAVFYLIAETLEEDLVDPEAIMSISFIHPASSGWDGDQCQLYVNPDGSKMMVWKLLWDSLEDRDEFIDEIWYVTNQRNPYFRFSVNLDTVTGESYSYLFFGNQSARSSLFKLSQRILQAEY